MSVFIFPAQMGSIETVSPLASHSQFLTTNHGIRRLSIPPNSQSRLPRLSFQITKLQLSPKFDLSPISHVPTSNLSKINNLLTIFFPEKVLVSFVGVLIFMGSFSFTNTKPSLALPAQVSDFSESTEEKRNTQMGRSEDEEMYEKILETEPRNVEALKVVVYRKMRRNKHKEAVKYVERLIDIEPDEVEWRLLEAFCHEMMGELGKAKRLFSKILKKRPFLLRALHGLALVMHKNREGAAVFDMLNKVSEVARRKNKITEERNIRILIAQMHVVKGELEDGLKKFQELVDENPRDFRPYLCQGIIYSLLDRKTEATEQFEMYQSLIPEEFPERSFLDNVVLSAKTQSQAQIQKEFEDEFSSRK